jgi:hypothetical protein
MLPKASPSQQGHLDYQIHVWQFWKHHSGKSYTDILSNTMNMEDGTVGMQVWDTIGQECSGAWFLDAYLTLASAVYDVTYGNSYEWPTRISRISI